MTTEDNSPLRWHSHRNPALRHSGETVQEHSLKVTEMCERLADAMGYDLYGSDLLDAAENHDAAEAVLGDIPGPAKDRFPALRAEYEAAERVVLAEMGLHWSLTGREKSMLHLCDKLDALLWARKHGDTDPEWLVTERKLRLRAQALGAKAARWLEGELTR